MKKHKILLVIYIDSINDLFEFGFASDVNQRSTDQSRLVPDRAVWSWEKNFKTRGWTGLEPRKISKSETGPDQDQENFQNLGPDNDREKFRTGPGSTKYRSLWIPDVNMTVSNIMFNSGTERKIRNMAIADSD